MPHRRHRPPFGEAYSAMFLRPVVKPRPWKFRSPSKASRERRKGELEGAARTALRADMIDEDELTAGLQHTDEIVERTFGIRNRGDDILRDHRIEHAIPERQIVGVHHRKHFDIGKAQRAHAALRLAQHRLGKIDPADLRRARIVRQRQPGAYSDIENAPADPVGFRNARLPAVIEHLAEHEIVDRRPATVGLFDPGTVDIGSHAPAPQNSLPAQRLDQWPRCGRTARRGLNETAAENTCLSRRRIIEYAGLTGRNALFARHQLNLVPTVRAAQPGGLRRASRPYAYENLKSVADCGIESAVTDPVDVAQDDSIHPERLSRADDNTSARGIKPQHIQRTARGNAEALALTDREMRNALMPSEHAATEVDDVTRLH